MWTSGVDLRLGKNLSIGKGVIIQITDGGYIKIGDNVALQDNVVLSVQRGYIDIGDDTFIGAGTHIVAIESIFIGQNCLIAAYCIIRDANHGMKKDTLINKQSLSSSAIYIADDVWLAAHVVVTPGVVINEGAVIGANAVVTHSINQYTVNVGVPTRQISQRNK